MWRPILNHALRCIDKKPAGYAPYHFVQYGDSEEETGEEVAWYDEVKVRFPIPDEILDRRDRLLTLTPNLKASEVLGQVGSPDHVRNKYEQIDKSGRWVENWEYDHRINSQWKTFRIRWIEIGGVPTIERLDESPSDWISSDLRVNEILDH